MEKRSQEELVDNLRQAGEVVEIGATYVHYKNPDQTYLVTGFAILEASQEVAVLYRANYGQRLIFARPLREWVEEVEREGSQVKRFAKL